MSDERHRLVAPCGIDCGNCALYRSRHDSSIMERLLARGIPSEKLPCDGCRNVAGHCPVLGGTCETFACAHDKAVDFCFECTDFPCSKLCPSSDRADVLPHNLKVFNLCTIERTGIEGFVKTSGDWERRYFKGRMAIGGGPTLADPGGGPRD